MSKTYELSYTAEHIDELLVKVDEGTIYQDASNQQHGLMSATDKAKLDALPTGQQIEDSLSDKVDKEAGKGLSKNDYTDADKAKVASALQSETDPTVPSWAKQQNKPTYTASEIGAIPTSEKGVSAGVATLNSQGKIPVSQLPSYVDDVLEYANLATFPATGETGKIYVALDTNKTYRWGGSSYVEISPSLALGETSSTAFAGNRGKAIEDKIPSNASVSNKLATMDDLPEVTTDYDNFTNKPQINSVTLSGNKSASDLGLATAAQGTKADTAYQKPLSGIPESDFSSDVQQALQKHFKGWYDTLEELKAAHTAIDGDSAYVKDASPATTWSIYVYDATASSDNNWADSGTDADTSNVQTFESGEEVNETYIDNTHLVNPKSGALPTAEDVMQLQAKLYGVTASEVKVIPLLNTNYFDGKYVKNDKTIQNGSIPTGGVPNGILIVNVSNVKKVRFLGFERDTATTAGYGFSANSIDPTSTAEQLDYAFAFNGEADSARAVELDVDIPAGMNYFVCTIYKYGTPSTAVMTLDSFYCYLYSGTNVSEEIDEVSKKVDDTHVDIVGGEKVTEEENIINILSEVRGYFSASTSNYQWIYTSGTKSLMIDLQQYLSQGYNRIVVEAGYSADGYGAYFSLTKQAMPSENITNVSSYMSEVMNGYTRYVVESNKNRSAELKEDSKYLYIPKRSTTSDFPLPINIYLQKVEVVEGEVKVICEEEISKKILPFTLNSNRSIYGIKDNNGEAGDEFSLTNHKSTSYIEVTGFLKIRFLGLRYKNSFYTGNNLQAGFAFYDEDKVALKPYCNAWYLGEDENAEYNGMPYEYEINVPKNACYFRCDTRDYDTANNFYCIGISNIQGSIDNLDGKTFVNVEPILMNTTFSNTSKAPSFNLIHFSDIHGDTVALQRIVDFRDKFKNYINDVLCTGDNVWYEFNHGMDFWDAVEGSESILNCLGNHDTTAIGGYHSGDVSAADCYDKFFAPYISDWGDVVISENQCYYYKDYPAYGIRLIVLDLYHPDNTSVVSDTLGTAQQAWFENALEGARTAQTPLHVIVAGHVTERNWSGHIDTPFDDLQRANDYVLDSRLPTLGSEAIGAIDNFIDAGGKFVCYLCGHMHSDSFRKFNNHSNMLSVVVQNASVREHNPGSPHGTIAIQSTGPNNTNARVIGEVSEDAFNLVSVDTLHTILTITRIGQNYDVFGRHLGSVCYDYNSNRIISQW